MQRKERRMPRGRRRRMGKITKPRRDTGRPKSEKEGKKRPDGKKADRRNERGAGAGKVGKTV